jgi:hypothetical protein
MSERVNGRMQEQENERNVFLREVMIKYGLGGSHAVSNGRGSVGRGNGSRGE